MIRVDFKQFQDSLDALQKKEQDIRRLARELRGMTQPLRKCENEALGEPVSRLVRYETELEEEVLVLRQMIRALQLARQQYQATAKAVLLQCESACFPAPAYRLQSVDLRQMRENMKDIPFGKELTR